MLQRTNEVRGKMMKQKEEISAANINENRSSGTGKLVCFALFIVLVVGIVCVIVGANSGNISTTVVGIILISLSLILLNVILTIFNRLVRINNKVAESLGLIDIQLKLRFDLIPNLVNTVKGYVKHEEAVFSELTELRGLAYEAANEKQKLAYANNMVPKMRQIVAIAENYPRLRADALFKSLMDELVVIEDKIVAARRIYDSNVNALNTEVMTFPSSIVAKLFDFNKVELFKIDAGERLNVGVSLD